MGIGRDEGRERPAPGDEEGNELLDDQDEVFDEATGAEEVLERLSPTRLEMLCLAVASAGFVARSFLVSPGHDTWTAGGGSLLRGTVLAVYGVAQPLVGRRMLCDEQFRHLLRSVPRGVWATRCWANIPRLAMMLVYSLCVLGMFVKLAETPSENAALETSHGLVGARPVTDSAVSLPLRILMAAVPAACFLSWFPVYAFLVQVSLGLIDGMAVQLEGEADQGEWDRRCDEYWALQANIEHIWGWSNGTAYVLPAFALLIGLGLWSGLMCLFHPCASHVILALVCCGTTILIFLSMRRIRRKWTMVIQLVEAGAPPDDEDEEEELE